MKVLILYASAGAGHKTAAAALAAAFENDDSEHEVLVCDILEFTPALFRQTYAKGYLRMVRRAPELWGYMYQQTDKKSLIPWRRKVRSTFNNINTRKFLEFYDDFRPDAVVCTHYMPLELLSTYARKGRRWKAPFCGIVTDFAVHSLWIVENVDCYYVATEAARRHLLRAGNAARVVTTGIPISSAFGVEADRSAIRRTLGLIESLPTVLVLSGGYGVGPALELIDAFSDADFCQLLIICGASETLREEAGSRGAGMKVPPKIMGFVDNMPEMLDAADLVITKSGGLTSSEILAKGVPMVIADPIPGQEQRNCDVLLESGAAVRLYEVADAPAKVEELLSDPDRIQKMREQGKRIGKPYSASTIVEDLKATVLPAWKGKQIVQTKKSA